MYVCMYVDIEVKVTDKKEKRCNEKKLNKNIKVTRAAMLGYQTDPVGVGRL